MAGTTPKGIALGGELRRTREAAGISKRQLSIKLGIDHTTIGRWEAGKRTPRPEDVTAFLAAVDAPAQLREELSGMARGGNAPRWLSAENSERERQISALIDYESRANAITDVSPLVLPGLLQTADYARAIMQNAGVSRDEIATRVAVRMGRREILTKKNPVTFYALLSEPVLRQIIGGCEVMTEQLRYIMEVSEWPNIVVQVIPADSGWHPALDGPFVMLEAADRLPVVHLENRRSGLFFHEKPDTDVYREAVESLKEAALTPEETRALVSKTARKMEKQ